MTETDLLDPQDLAATARAGWQIGLTACRDCGGYHRLWGFMRAAKVLGGVDNDAAILIPLLSSALRPGAKVLIAGSADHGVLDLVARASAGRPIDVQVADRCPSPMRLIERIRPYPGVTVSTTVADLTQMDDVERWDLVVCHSMLAHIPQGLRYAFLTGVRNALAPAGRLVITARTVPVLSSAQLEQHDEVAIGRIRRLLEDSGLAFPTEHDQFEADLREWVMRRRTQFWELSRPEQITEVLEGAGLIVHDVIESHAPPRLNLPAGSIDRRAFVFVAGRGPDPAQ